MDLTPEALAEEFSKRFRVKCPEVRFSWKEASGPAMTVPAAHPDVESMTITFDDEELTVQIGAHYHCHFDLFRYGLGGERAKDTEQIDPALDWIRSFLDGHIVLEIRKVDGRYAGGSTYPSAGLDDARVPPGFERFTWSGPLRHAR